MARSRGSRNTNQNHDHNRGDGTRNRGGNNRNRGNARNASFGESVGTQFSVLSDTVGSGRLAVVLVCFAAIALIFFARLFYLQVVVASEYSAMAEETRTISYQTTPRRGTIYDRNGVVLATSVDATTIYCNPLEVTDVESTAEQLMFILGGEQQEYVDILSTPETTFAYIKRQADVEKAEKIKELELPGIYFINDTRREYPNGAIGGQVIGFCNVDGEGITGLELQYNDILKGTSGSYAAERGEQGTPIPGGVVEDIPAVDGQDIMVSLDIKLQESVEQALAQRAEQLNAGSGNAVVMDAASGEIYAVCSLPYMNPSNMAESEVGSDNVKAITTAFEPGSIFKTVSIWSVLHSRTLGPDDTIFCPSVIEADGYEVSDAHERDDETMSLREILDNSSNVGVSLAVEQTGFDKLYEAINTFKLNELTGVDFPGESGGYMQDFSTWARITGYNVSFGQGISVTPLQMTRFYATIANDGVMVTPHFLISKPQTNEHPEYPTEQVFDDQEALDNITSMLRTVVTDGTGTLANIDGYDVVGKTSTAEVARDGEYVEGLYNICFTGYIENSSSQLVCFVSANEVYGQASVTSTFKDIMSNAIKLYNIVPE